MVISKLMNGHDIISDIDAWYDINFKEFEKQDFYSRVIFEDYDLLQDINDFYEENMVYETDSDSDPTLEHLESKVKKLRISKRMRRIQAKFQKASKFHMLDEAIQNAIVDDIEAKQRFIEIAKKYKISYQNLLNWKKKGVLQRP